MHIVITKARTVHLIGKHLKKNNTKRIKNIAYPVLPVPRYRLFMVVIKNKKARILNLSSNGLTTKGVKYLL